MSFLDFGNLPTSFLNKIIGCKLYMKARITKLFSLYRALWVALLNRYTKACYNSYFCFLHLKMAWVYAVYLICCMKWQTLLVIDWNSVCFWLVNFCTIIVLFCRTWLEKKDTPSFIFQIICIHRPFVIFYAAAKITRPIVFWNSGNASSCWQLILSYTNYES